MTKSTQKRKKVESSRKTRGENGNPFEKRVPSILM